MNKNLRRVTSAFMTQVGALNTAPILIAVVTSFISIEAVKDVVMSRRRTASPPEKVDQPSASQGGN
jgi:hypothetical protein